MRIPSSRYYQQLVELAKTAGIIDPPGSRHDLPILFCRKLPQPMQLAHRSSTTSRRKP